MKSLDSRSKRKIRIRKKVYGDASKPRLAVYKSNKNIYVQAIDDLNQTTIINQGTDEEQVIPQLQEIANRIIEFENLLVSIYEFVN